MLKTNKYINYCDLISFSWNTVISNIGFFIKIALVYVGINIAFAIPGYFLESNPAGSNVSSGFANFALQLLQQIVGVMIAIGWIKICFAFCDGYKPSVGMLFDYHGCFWRYIAVSIMYSFIIVGGILLLVVPGIIWGVKFSLCQYFVVTKGLGPVEALKASARATEGMKWHWFGFTSLCGMIMVLGLMCLLVGGVVSYPVAMIAMVLGYRQLSAQTPELAEFGIDTIASHTQPETVLPISPEPEQPQM